MTPAARLSAVIEILDEILASEQPADGLMSAYFRNRRFIGSKDRAAVAEKAYSILREMLRLQWWLRQHNMPVTGRTLLLAHETLVNKQSIVQLEKLFDGERFSPQILQRSEKNFCGAIYGNRLSVDEMDDATQMECPEWAYPYLKEKFGDQFITELTATLMPAPLDIRINTLKVASREAAITALMDEGIDVVATELSPWGLRSDRRPALSRSDTFQNGLIEIQDEGSQLIALLCDVQPGQQVMDLCAGAGGKTLALAMQMDNKGRLVACDLSEGRLRRSKERFKRAGVQNTETRALDGEGNKWLKRQMSKFDRVLVDAPCTGTGTWRRNPDLRWRSPNLGELIRIQASLLESAAKLVKPGGKLIYGTCSFLDQENKNQIEQFLANHSDFTISPINEILPATTFAHLSQAQPQAGDPVKLNPQPDPRNTDEDDFMLQFMELTPARHNTDGFFAAILQKRAQP